MPFRPELFFNMLAFGHPLLWGKDEPVWAGIANLSSYLGTMLAQTTPDPYRTGPGLILDPTVRVAQPFKALIAPTAIIKPYTVIEDEVIIEDGAVVGPHAYIRGGAIICRNARVGHGTEVKHSVMFPGAKASHGNRVLDSLIGCNVNLGAHLITTNLRADGATVSFRLDHGVKIDTGLRKLGIIAGDDSFFGCKLQFNPGKAFAPKTRLT